MDEEPKPTKQQEDVQQVQEVEVIEISSDSQQKQEQQEEPSLQSVFDVDKILDKAYNKKKKQWYYLIKWLDYDIAVSTWEPVCQISHLTAIVEDFQSNYNQSKIGLFQHGIYPPWIKKIPKKSNKTIRKQMPTQTKHKKEKRGQPKININQTKTIKQQPTVAKKQMIPNENGPLKQITTKNQIKQENKRYVKQDNTQKTEEDASQQNQIGQYTQNKIQTNQIIQNQNQIQHFYSPILRAQVLGMRNILHYSINYNGMGFIHPINGIYQFLVEDFETNQKSWMTRSQVLQKYSVQLCLFYEQYVQLQQ